MLGSTSFAASPQQQSEHHSVGEEKQRHDRGRNKERYTHGPRGWPDSNEAIVERVNQIAGAQMLKSQTATGPQEVRRTARPRNAKIAAIRSPYAAGRANAAQVRPNNAGHEKTEPDEAKRMKREQRSERLLSRQAPELRPEVARSDHAAPGGEAKQNADAKEG